MWTEKFAEKFLWTINCTNSVFVTSIYTPAGYSDTQQISSYLWLSAQSVTSLTKKPHRDRKINFYHFHDWKRTNKQTPKPALIQTFWLITVSSFLTTIILQPPPYPNHPRSRHLLLIPLEPKVHFLNSSSRSSYSHFQLDINSPWKVISKSSIQLLWLALDVEQVKQHRRKAVSNIFVVVDGSCLPIPYIAYNFPNEKKN